MSKCVVRGSRSAVICPYNAAKLPTKWKALPRSFVLMKAKQWSINCIHLIAICWANCCRNIVKRKCNAGASPNSILKPQNCKRKLWAIPKLKPNWIGNHTGIDSNRTELNWTELRWTEHNDLQLIAWPGLSCRFRFRFGQFKFSASSDRHCLVFGFLARGRGRSGSTVSVQLSKLCCKFWSVVWEPKAERALTIFRVYLFVGNNILSYISMQCELRLKFMEAFCLCFVER